MANRRCQLIILDQTSLTEMIQPCFPGQSVVDFQLMKEGLINTNYKVQLSNYTNPLLVRIYARDPHACQRETDIISLISPTVLVPEVIYSCTSNSPIGKPYTILQWCEGVTLHEILTSGSTSDVESAICSAGEMLAAIGKYSFDQSGFFGSRLIVEQPFDNDPTAFMHKYLADPAVHKRLGNEIYGQISEFIIDNAACLKQTTTKAALVHGDFNSRNILVKQTHGHWRVSAILDWEWAHAGTTLFDIGSMLRNEAKYPIMESQFIDGFTNTGGKLPTNWKQISKFIDFNNLLELLSGTEELQWVFDEAKQVIVSTMTEWESFV